MPFRVGDRFALPFTVVGHSIECGESHTGNYNGGMSRPKNLEPTVTVAVRLPASVAAALAARARTDAVPPAVWARSVILAALTPASTPDPSPVPAAPTPTALSPDVPVPAPVRTPAVRLPRAPVKRAPTPTPATGPPTRCPHRMSSVCSDCTTLTL